MKKRFIRLIAMFCTLILLSTYCVTVFAVNSTSKETEYSGIANAILREADVNPGAFAKIDMSRICVSNKIKAYEFNGKELTSDTDYIALTYNGKLFAWAIKIEDGAKTSYQISDAYVNEINPLINDNTPFALVYDSDTCYFYDGTCLKKLGTFTEVATDRARLYSFDKIKESKSLLVNINKNFRESSSLNGYLKSNILKTQIYYKCSVNYVTQKPYMNICWAASIACAVNSVKKTSYTAVQVAKYKYGNTDFNNTLSYGDEVAILRHYGVVYSYQNKKPSDNIIVKNVKYGWPIVGEFDAANVSVGHYMTVYGINVIGGYIYIMDPMVGLKSATATSSGYSYYSAIAKRNYILKHASCRYWR